LLTWLTVTIKLINFSSENGSSSSEIDSESDNVLYDSNESINNRDDPNDDLSAHEHPIHLNQNSNIFDNITEVAEELHLFDRLCASSDETLMELILKLTRLNKTGILSETALGKVIELIYCALPKPNICPPNKDKYLEIVQKLSPPEVELGVKFCCSVCMGPFEDEASLNQRCPECEEARISLWIKNDVKSTLKNMLEVGGLAGLIETENIRKEKCKQESVISDVGDGLAAKRLKKGSIYDLYLIHNADSFTFPNSYSKQIWAHFLSFADVPPPLRRRFTILATVSYNPETPSFIEHMSSFAMDMQDLALKGLKWIHPVTKCEISSRVHMMASTMPAEFRASVLNINQSNKPFGCSFCEIEGERISVGKDYTRVYPFSQTTTQNVARTRNSLKDQADVTLGDDEEFERRQAAGTFHRQSFKGVKGYSSMLLVPSLNVINGFSPDVLHSCFMGVVQRWTKLIFQPKNQKEPYYVGNLIETVNDKLKQMQTPVCDSRPLRCLKDLSLWEASEFRNWLFYFSLPCLHKSLPSKFLDHHILLVQAIYNLCKSAIKPNELKEAKTSLIKYCSEFSKLYGKSEETFDLHMLLHYGSSVEHIGPLWAHSTFLFASANASLRSSIPGTLDMETEMINSAKIHNALSAMDQISAVNFTKSENEITMLGAPVPIDKIDNINAIVKLSSLAKEYKIKATSLQVYERVRYKGVDYTAETFCRATNSGTPYVSVKSELADKPTVVLKALYFVYISKRVQLVIGNHVNLNGARFITKCATFYVNHLQRFSVTRSIVHKNIASIECPMFRSLSLLSKPPNNFDLHM
jgi:hypothetical protein